MASDAISSVTVARVLDIVSIDAVCAAIDVACDVSAEVHCM